LVIGPNALTQVINNYLTPEPYYIKYFTSSKEAFLEIQKNAHNIAIYDDELSATDSYMLLKELCTRNESHSLATICLVDKEKSSKLTYNVDAVCSDYLIKPFTKHELLTRIRVQSTILNANSRLTRLRTFTKQIARVKDVDTLLFRTFSFLQEEPCLADVTLFKGLRVQYSNSSDTKDIENIFCQTDLSKKTGDRYAFYQEGYHYLFFCLSDTYVWTFIIRIRNTDFSNIESEYIQNVIHQVSTIQDKLDTILCDCGTITNLYNIISKRDQILFIKSAKQYVELYTKKQRPELLTISLKQVNLYLKDHLLKVHRSYLINPKEIKKIHKKKRGRYEIHLNEHIIPIGEVFLPALQEKFSQWFLY
jgi:DNA-binding response OmpR family regulator